MSAEVSAQSNGTFTSQGYGGNDQNNYNTYNTATQSSSQAAPASSTSNNAASSQQDVSKDEVGWYFVEQYYTTLSRTPDRLHLFYNKRSQFVSGQETDKVEVCVGQKAINDKIQELDFQDCKVRVTNVDSQASDSNIVIQVIGEISNKSQPHKKFTQTFVLATQTNGYFVLNDIFRYLIEDEDEVEGEAVAQPEETAASEEPTAPAEAEPKTLADPVAIEKVDKSLEEEKAAKESAPEPVAEPVTNGTSGDQADAEASEEKKIPNGTSAADSTATSERPTTGDSDTPAEVPKEPEPTRVATPAASTPAPPAPAPKAPAPALPKTWANLAAAANRVATPIKPAAPSSTTSKQPKATPSGPSAAAPAASAPATGPAATSAAAPPATSTPPPTAPAKDVQDDEWTAVGGSHNRQVSRQTNAPAAEAPAYRGYIKGVFDHVAHDELKAQLEQFGELSHFDIARGPKNCAFVDFKDADGFKKALNTTFELQGDKLYVEERRPPRQNGPNFARGSFQGRGGRGGMNGQGAPRGGSNFPQGGRGNFGPRGRGGAPAPRGTRGQAQ